MRCECGCRYQGPDPAAEWLLAEAIMIRLESVEMLRQLRDLEQQQLAALADDTRAAAVAALERG